MPQNYVPIFIFIAIVGTLLPITLLAAKLVRPDNPSKTKLMPYECGIDPVDSARGRYTVRYYIIAILFVVFDVETIFLFPWAVKFKSFGLFGLAEMMIFLVILVVGTSGCGKKARWNGSKRWRMKSCPQPPDNPMDSSPAETFPASRWTQGNFFFPTRLIVSPQRVSASSRACSAATRKASPCRRSRRCIFLPECSGPRL